ncbi:MAG: MarR family winged helix-turn-helix transcriptional regulator [Defluviicoccus sp.]|nr:MarR family winged helix-turn-helix transcriptional regulator [Defluviicoccus sp.]MDE0386714.1 MarR family winged helix-turn-helix transcriptional regulator [Defluviicoccus sp.]
MNQSNDSREDSAGLRDRPGFLLRLCLQETGQAFEQGCAEVGLTPRQFDFLFVLNRIEETTQDRLARILVLDRSTTGLVVGILERKGLVERRVAPADKRKRLVRSTDRGRAAFAKASPAAEAAKARLFERLSEGERGQLMRLLRKISQPSPRAGDRLPEAGAAS